MDAHGQQWNLRKYTSFSFQKVAHPSGTTVQLAAETCDINSFPLIPAETAFRGSPSYWPISPSSIAPLTGRNRPTGGPPKPCAWINPFLAHIKRWRYIRWRCLWRSQIISAHVSRLHSRISGWFVQFLSSLLLNSFTFWRVLTAAWQQWTLDSEFDFDGFVIVLWPWGLVKTNILR